MSRLRHLLRLTLARLGRRLGRPEILDGAILLLTLAGAWLVALHQGGARAEGPLLGARLILAAACLHSASAAIRAERGYPILRGSWIILPFVAWLAIDAAWLAVDRGAALESWTIAALGAAAVWMTLHHARRTWSQALALLLLVGPASLMASGAYDTEGGQVRALIGLAPDPAYGAAFSSAFGSPGACAAVMLLGLLPSLAAALNPRLRIWLRVVSAYFALLLGIGLYQTQHGWAWVGFVLGAAFAGQALRSRKGPAWMDLRLVAVAGAALAWMDARFAGIGVLKGGGGHPLAEAAWSGFLAHPLAGGGHGSFPLAFEAVRPSSWQTDPTGPGSLLLQLLVEHGVLGVLLAAVPLAAVLAAAGRTALTKPPDAAPMNADAVHRRNLRRTLVAGGAAGVAAALWTLCLDHPGGQPGVVLLALLALATVHRAADTAEESSVAWPARGRAAWVAVALPVLLAPLALSPLQAARLAQPASEVVRALSPASIGGGALLDRAGEDTLRGAVAALDLSLRLNPWHAERTATRAQALALLTRQSPNDRGLAGLALAESARAAEMAPRLVWPRLVHGSILLGSLDPAGRAAGMEEIEAARRLAPRNQAVTLRRAQALGQVAAPPEALRAALEEARQTSPALAEIPQRLSLLPAKEGAPR